MTFFPLTAFFATLSVFSLVLALPRDRPARSLIQSYILPGNNSFPEGIARQPNSPYFFTGSSQDGTIYRGNVNKPMIEVFVPSNVQKSPSTVFGMKADKFGRLFVASGSEGVLFVYDVKTGELLHRFSNNQNGTFLNDMAVAEDGTVYATDSYLPYLYHVPVSKLNDSNAAVDQALEIFITLAPTVEYQAGAFNTNGIIITPDQRYAIVGDLAERSLYRISLKTKEITKIDLGGKTIGATDGLLFRDDTIYSVSSDLTLGVFIDVIEITKPYLNGKPLRQITSPLLIGPATAAFDGDDLLVPNFQLSLPVPQIPFTVVRVPIC